MMGADVPRQRVDTDTLIMWATLDLQQIRESWGDLLAACIPGTPRPWAEVILSAKERAETDALARIEREERGADAIGEHQTPVVFDVLAVVVDTETGLLELEHRVRRRLGFGPAERAAPLAGEPRGWAHWAAVWIEDALPAVSAFPDLAVDVSTTARRLASSVRNAVGTLDRCLHLKARCFVCGESTLRLYSGPRLVDGYVLCVNAACDPSEEQCGSRLRGRPMWPYEELEWLSQKIAPLAATGSE